MVKLKLYQGGRVGFVPQVITCGLIFSGYASMSKKGIFNKFFLINVPSGGYQFRHIFDGRYLIIGSQA